MSSSRFYNLIEGKSIAFVGMSPNIKGAGYGHIIDKYDLVYRTNMFPIPESLTEDYGSRCDILGIQNAYKKLIPEYLKTDIKCIVHYGGTDVVLEDKEKICFIATQESRKTMADYVNTLTTEQMQYPTAGIVAYFICMLNKCKSFTYFGVTGYQKEKGVLQNHEGENNYIGQYLDFWDDRKDRLIKTDMINNAYHNFKAHNEFLSILKKHNFVKFDPESSKYF
jgi:hypothetical protein